MKTCHICKKKFKNKSGNPKVCSIECRREKERQRSIWRRENEPGYKESVNIRSAKWQKENGNRVKENHLKRTFGITLDQKKEILRSQKGKCAICGTNKPSIYAFNVDHCHKSGVIRGLLCYQCNAGLGIFKDSQKLLQRAINYLIKPRKI